MSASTRTPRDVGTTPSRDRIMDVAERLMAQNGYAATSISAICAESGLPVGSVYHHFGSKIGLLGQVLLRGRDRLFASFPLPPPGPPRDRLVAHYASAGRATAANLAFFRIEAGLLLHAAQEPEIRPMLAEMHAGGLRRAAVLFSAIAADAGAADPERVGLRISAATISFSRGAVSQFAMTPQRLSQAYGDLATLMWQLVVDSRAAVPGAALVSTPGPRAAHDPAPRVARDSRQRFLDVAEQLIADSGYTATSVADVCARAGLPVGSLYHHFGSKFGLLQAVLEQGLDRFGAALPDLGDVRGSPRERLVGYYRGAAATVAEHLAYFRIVLALRAQPPADPRIREWMVRNHRRGYDRVRPVLRQIAEAAGVADAADLARQLAEISLILTDGAVFGLDVDETTLRSAFGDVAELLWGTMSRRAALAP